MNKNNPQAILKRLHEFSEEYSEDNYSNKAHHRSILYELKISKREWPDFNEDLDNRLYYSTHYQIWKSLEILKSDKNQETAIQYLKEGAESLEYLYTSQPELPDEIKIEILFKSILSYYISGNHACAYVLSKELSYYSELPPLLNLIFAIMHKNLSEVRLIIARVFSDEKYKEENLITETLDIDEKLSRVIYYSTVKAISYYLEFLKSGSENLFKKSLFIINTCVEMSKDLNYVDYWWWLYCLSFILIESYEKSLWKNLKFLDNDQTKKYIKNYLGYNPPITELWPSQLDSIPYINDEKRKSFCLKMPTSSGKTFIAELSILRFFSDFPDLDKKCVYIAPYRSLAVQVEKNLRKGLSSVGIKTSEIYGDHEINPVEEVLVEESNVLVVTPEKFDVIFRYGTLNPEDIGLIIIDEGHLINSSNKKSFLKQKKSRNITFEFLLHRLLNKLKDCRFLFISAVLPDAENIARWISGSSNQLLDKEWRPTRLMIGNLTWTQNKNLELNYNRLNHKLLQDNISINNFISSIDLSTIKSTKKRTQFPNNAKQALALSALKFAQDGATLVYAPKKDEVESFAEQLLDVIKIQNSISEEIGEEILKLEVNEKHLPLIEQCKNVIKTEMNNNSKLITYLDHGFLFHHSDLPKRVKNSIEDLVKDNIIKLIVATTTIANGVNLPIKTVLIKGLYQSQYDTLDSMQFWNICGRAGRAGKENEGQALFLIDKEEIIRDKGPKKLRETKWKHRKKLRIIEEITTDVDINTFSSTISILLTKIVEMWNNKYPNSDLSILYNFLIENDFEWALNDKKDLIFWIDKLDTYILALSEEFDEDIMFSSDLQNIISKSLFYISINEYSKSFINRESIQKILNSRLKYIYSKYPSDTTRKSIYKLGLSVSTFEIIEENIEELNSIFNYAFLWDILSNEAKIDYLIRISSLVLKLENIFENMDIWNSKEWVPDQWKLILRFWLNGTKIEEMIENKEIKSYSSDAGKVNLFLDKFCGDILSWGINSLINFYKVYNSNINEIPEIVYYLPNIIKYGILSPKAVCIMPYINFDRQNSLLLARICPFSFKNPEKIVAWIKNLNLEMLLNEDFNFDKSQEIIEILNTHKKTNYSRKKFIIKFKLKNKPQKEIKHGDKLFLTIDPDKNDFIKLYTLNGEFLSSKKKLNSYPEWIFKSNVVDYYILDIEHLNGNYIIHLAID